MNGTPRLRSAFPSTPESKQNAERQKFGPVSRPVPASTSNFPSGKDDTPPPLIPFSILDAPSQRFYILAFYICLMAWRLYDYSGLVSEETDSLWLFMKWVAIDVVFLFGLPGLQIPWLQWSSAVMTVLFLAHAVMNGFLMFRIPIPLDTFFWFLLKFIWDRELAISERRVKPGSILHNGSLILGKQIIHILPEGSAMLNPERNSFCLGSSKSTIDLPIRINQTDPISIQLIRIDLDTNENEIITISRKEAKKFKKIADKEYKKTDTSSPRTLRLPIKKTGLYRLYKVIDESSLEVQRRVSDALVVQCPSASVKAVPQDKCKGELSDFYFQVDATPPLKIRYSKTINQGDESNVFLTIHPENLDSPLARQENYDTIVRFDPERSKDVTWARTQHLEIPINETLGIGGSWQYSILEIYDACDNVVKYFPTDEAAHHKSHQYRQLNQKFLVHERPKASLRECGSERPIKVAKDKSCCLPIKFAPLSSDISAPPKYSVSYTFTPQQGSTLDEERAVVQVKGFTIKAHDQASEIREPGMYSLTSVSTQYCAGEIMEPASCLLLNPPRPDLSITYHPIPDVCAGFPIGLTLELDMVGTPPFEVTYSIRRDGGPITSKIERVDRMKTQLELKPAEAGHYTYQFVDIRDSVYQDLRPLKGENFTLEQDVKPPPSAYFKEWNPVIEACIQESIAFEVATSGQTPWTLVYNILYGGKRVEYTAHNIEGSIYNLTTPVFTKGGQYVVALSSMIDNTMCKTYLQHEAKIEVRHQKPSVAFGHLEGKRSISTLEEVNIDLPLRLTGEPPWTISYQHKLEGTEISHVEKLHDTNAVLKVQKEGAYEISNIVDRLCPGYIDPAAQRFDVSWISRPSVKLLESSTVKRYGINYIKEAVCEGDQDAMDVLLFGTPPYYMKYQVCHQPIKGSSSLSTRKKVIGLRTATIEMEAAQAGVYRYELSELGDQLYEHDRQKFTTITVEQKVYGRPAASFVNVGRTYSYCKEEEAKDEIVPITLVGTPPFTLEIGIKHQSTAKPEIMTIPNIEINRYDFHMPHGILALGTHSITIRKIVDSHGCQKISEYDGPVVYINVVDIPTISPLQSTTDYCVGDRISYTLSGTPPFSVYYTFEGVDRKAAESTINFRRLAEKPGNFTITGVSDKVSSESCKRRYQITRMIHAMPSVRISKGRTSEIDIHEGGETEILFEFSGTPPFEFTYTRSTNSAKGKRSIILETRNDVSNEYTKKLRVSEEGTYEVVSIRDRFCGFTTQQVKGISGGQQRLMLA